MNPTINLGSTPSEYKEIKTEIKEDKKENSVIYKGHPERKNEILSYAYDISKDQEFVKMLLGENGALTVDAINRNKNGTYDKGICQFNSYYRKHIINDVRFKDWRWQLEQCLILWKGGTRFYGADHRRKFKHLLVFN